MCSQKSHIEHLYRCAYGSVRMCVLRRCKYILLPVEVDVFASMLDWARESRIATLRIRSVQRRAWDGNRNGRAWYLIAIGKSKSHGKSTQ